MEGVGNAFGLFLVSEILRVTNDVAVLDIDLHIRMRKMR